MITRTLAVALALGLAACGQPSNQQAASDPNSPGNELPTAADLLSAPPLVGTWEAVGDGATVGIRFTSKDYPDTLTIGCDGGTMRAFVNWTISDAAQNGEVRIYTAAKTETFAATATNDGAMHLLSINVDGKDARLAPLKAKQDRFAVQGFGQAIVVPWVQGIADNLNECAH
jgi:hypothetical protein